MSGYNKVYEIKKIEVETEGIIKILEGCTVED